MSTHGIALSAPSTEAINEFYTYATSGLSVLYCSGSSEYGNVITQTITMQCAPPAGATIKRHFWTWWSMTARMLIHLLVQPLWILGGVSAGAGVMAGIGNLWNFFVDSGYGDPISPADYSNPINLHRVSDADNL